MKKNSANHFAIVLMIVAICFVYSWQVLVPRYQANNTELISVNAELSSARQKLTSLQTAQGSLSELGSYTDKVFVSAPGSVDAPNLLSELEAIATKYQTIIPAITISDSGSGSTSQGAVVATSSTPNAVPISFTVDGDFQSLNGFIASLEHDIRFMNIKTLSLTSGKDKMSLAVQLEAYKRSSDSLSLGTASSSISTSDSATDSSLTGGQ